MLKRMGRAKMEHLYIPLDKFDRLDLETNLVLKERNSPIRYARFRYTAEVWYPPKDDTGIIWG